MYCISVPNLKEIHSGEGWLKVIILNRCKEEKCKDNWVIFGNAYLANCYPIHFKFSMYNHVYEEHKICNFDRNQSNRYRDMRC